MVDYNLNIYDAANFLNSAGNPAIQGSDLDGVLIGTGPFRSGTDVPTNTVIRDLGQGGVTGTTVDFEDGPTRAQFLTAPLTLSYRNNAGNVVTQTFGTGTQVQAEFVSTFSSGYKVVALRFQVLPGPGNLVTAGYTVLPPPGGDPTPPPGFNFGTLTNTNAEGTVPWSVVPPCFTWGTRIAVPGGTMAIERIGPGQLVVTRDHGARPVEWAGRVTLPAARVAQDPRLWPVTFPPGTLGNGMPLRVSPAHRVLLQHPVAELVTGHAVCLAPAAALVGLGGVTHDAPRGALTYLHLRLAHHAILWAEGAPVESLWGGWQMAALLHGPAPSLAPRCEPLVFPLARQNEARLIFAAILANAGRAPRGSAGSDQGSADRAVAAPAPSQAAPSQAVPSQATLAGANRV